MATVIKNIPFVGGDTATFEFDFGTKVYDSMAECPMNVYYCAMSSLQPPSNQTSDVTAGWRKFGSSYHSQSDYDALKLQDGTCINPPTYITGAIMQIMIELDLNPLCNSLFGGSHSAIVSALSAVIPVVYTKGSGANNGTLVYGVGANWWNDVGTANTGWNGASSGWGGYTNTSNSIQAITMNLGLDRAPINTDNKLRMLIYALHPSDGTIASEVDLDYINIKVQFARVPDVIAPIPITLPETWSMLIKGFAPAWDGSILPNGKVILTLSPKYNDFNNFIMVQKYASTANTYRVVMLVASTKVADLLITQTITKFKTINFLLTKNNNILTFYLLINGSVINKQSTTISSTLSGALNMYIGQRQDNAAQVDGFINSVIFLPNKTFDDDTEAEAVLRGTKDGFENDELFDISKVPTGNPNGNGTVTVSNNQVIINSTNAWGGKGFAISVLPNNKYHFHCDFVGPGYFVRIDQSYNGIIVVDGSSGVPEDCDIITGPKTNTLWITITNSTAGTITYSNMSLKLKM